MPKGTQAIETNEMHELLMQYKYCDAVVRLARGITHEYNNIFTGLTGQTAILFQEGEDCSVFPKREALIKDLLQRGIEQTEILFGFSRDDPGSKRPHSPERLAKKAVDLLNLVSRLHSFELHGDQRLPKIFSKQRDILLLLFYLGENAIEAMADGGKIRLELFHGSERDGIKCVTFNLIDSGCGFAEEMQNIAFDPFTTTKKGYKTRGIGLYAVKKIVSDHGGWVELGNRPEGGVAVRVNLPVMQDTNKDTNKDTKQNIVSGAVKVAGSHQEKYTILLVDDEAAMRDILSRRLQQRGHVVFCVESCAEAIEEFSHLFEIISVVLLDVGLRDASGYACAKKLRIIDKNVRIIFMSGSRDDAFKELDWQASFIKKPFSIEQLEQIVGNEEI